MKLRRVSSSHVAKDDREHLVPLLLSPNVGVIHKSHHTSVWSGGDETQCFVHARQALYHLSYKLCPSVLFFQYRFFLHSSGCP